MAADEVTREDPFKHETNQGMRKMPCTVLCADGACVRWHIAWKSMADLKMHLEERNLQV